jgi:hypothetical protein
MPNWCSNNAEFFNEDIEKVNALEAHLTKLKDEEKEPGLFGFFIPRPAEFDQGDRWYGWNCENWGTKWEVTEVYFERIDDNTLRFTFETAWSPPLSFYEWLSINTTWYVNASYFEPGMAFIGRVVEGEDESYTYSDIESLDAIPEELVDEFGLREQMEEWEEENDEWNAEAELEKIVESFNNDEVTPGNAFAGDEGRNWLKGLLHERAVTVVFTKKDGTDREMRCTLNENMIPFAESDATGDGTRKKSSEAQPVYDLDAKGWRSFRWDSIKAVNFSLG